MLPRPTPLLVPIQSTRVRRNYRGGGMLDALAGRGHAIDGFQPEDWIGSTIEARNPGLPPRAAEGLTRTSLPAPLPTTLAELFALDPAAYLGAGHAGRVGPHMGFLAKLLDASIRLHVQAHPTADFARARLQSPHGKLEVYHILAVRPGAAGTIWLGFQRPPTREGWRRIIADQDLRAMADCFDPIPVQPGETWIVPGGLPHAIGDGVLMVEVMEPSDWVVRCEFEREGAVVPPEARFMGRDLDFCLDVFDYTARSAAEIRALCQVQPRRIHAGTGWELEQLVGVERTSCFALERLSARHAVLLGGGRGTLVIATRGAGRVTTGKEVANLAPGTAVFVAAAAPELMFVPGPEPTEWLLCTPASGG
jgi:mannose-6-phosphate isomerase